MFVSRRNQHRIPSALSATGSVLPRRTLARRVASLAVVLGCIIAAPARSDDQTTYEENQVKGAFLAKFALFVEWPKSAFAAGNSPVTIGIIGEDPFGPHYEALLGKELANGRPFKVRRFKKPQEIKDCQILFVSSSESERLPEILKAVSGQPVLVVGDQERFAHRGGMVNFVKEGGKLRFEVNMAVVGASGLKMSAKLLQVAKQVKTETGKEGG